MTHTAHNKLVSFIWSIADDCLRDVYVRGKYRDIILPFVVLRRIDSLLETTKDAVLEEVRYQREDAGQIELDPDGLRHASKYVFYNTSPWTMEKLKGTATNSQQKLVANFEEYLLGFSANVQEIIEKFNLRAQIRHMAAKDVLLDVLEKFTSPYINLTPLTKNDPEGRLLPALSNLGMGYVFEELIRKFNEENNEEAGEHFTPREVIQLMTHLVFEPLKDHLPNIITIYDPACGSGGMLTESENYLVEDDAFKYKGDVYLYGKEINDETYAICKSDMMIKGKDPENIRVGSTLSTNEFSDMKFDFMLSNPPYGKSWASEQKYIKDGKDVIDSRFQIKLKDYWGNWETVDATPRSSDGQLLFLMEMVDKMKAPTSNKIGSRIASVHNGSSLFTGDAGSGESNIRRYIIENDLLDAIVQMPNNLFYNTGITTYIWLLNNNKPATRKGHVQLLDANKLFQKLRKNLGSKNSEFSPAQIGEIVKNYLENKFESAENDLLQVKRFKNADFGYYKVNIERPKRLKSQFTAAALDELRFDKALKVPMQVLYETYGDLVYTDLTSKSEEINHRAEKEDWGLNKKQLAKLIEAATWNKPKTLYDLALVLWSHIGDDEFKDFNAFSTLVDDTCKKHKVTLTAAEKKAILSAISIYDAEAEKVIKKVEKITGDKKAQLLNQFGCSEEQLSLFGYYPSAKAGEFTVYETESDLRDSEQIPLDESIISYFEREVLPHVEEAWINLDSVKIGYEISFNKYFYKHTPLRSIEEVKADLLALEEQADGLLQDILNF
ncbi:MULTISPECIES: type I restriction-modification system subunit M [Sphingobacterium]|uniref:site-specific DNA-methyltransferase (adenine-specific) n=1 Tax=Sphingobacterium multivorum TaxID=28454 RepID=A0A654CVQ5_SPHMU|nr:MULTISPECIES: class I SAM-dependent DNA methyltransferase [Sphingobacterium]HBI86986.1 DNA methylase [Sphingobacterium sp.]OJZ15176.1 MAG: DNA methylase [Sphingobacterium sp. 40-24]QQT44615.1 SAM-dependent DNA methyltransferase [Sphingobacterium multivorum]SUJ87873.1 Probable type I restriction enzyme BthVORF4518P M protein [Sphingobacterium multivorum]VXC94859.1 putative Site-specific DNA-methyltransferase (adenine-specific) [Sphingobacterium multivorum]